MAKNTLEKFVIKNLFNTFDYEISFENNRLVLVGENGSGKSTFVSILYYLLSLQWDKLDDYPFDSLEIVVNGGKAKSVSKNDILKYNQFHKRRRFRRFPSSLIRQVETSLENLKLSPKVALNNVVDSYENLVKNTNLNIPLEIFQELLYEFIDVEREEATVKVSNIIKYIKQYFSDPIIFLPTYRRIERDIKKIFPDLEKEIRSHNEGTFPAKEKRQLELVEFGMGDVKKLIHRTTMELGIQFRTDLESLTGQYLSNILNNEYKDVSIEKFQELSKDSYELILNRVHESILSPHDKKNLQTKIESLSQSNQLMDSDKLIAYFLIKLKDLHEKQQNRESRIRKFVDLCNKYLEGKKLRYNNIDFELKIVNKVNQESISLESLSSGEKQIISLFAHLLLSRNTNYFLIFDEPELSLSVPWQRTFLLDISELENCAGLIAVTHSPFIFENNLEKYAHSINEFITVRQ
ncbi:AAA family ATPase [Spirochaeta lutea]|uniref:AAA+ ATPase domain-containing protein n=1 Tax=Spirochaeta lutea TaxID=1480694 RepID=A0A098R124_9SPIO|nr:AAA family ATPase [Spirochaeta lutea]KGE73476.1 hypothetical protein DC28_03390 [Spirochaeta lutea]